MAVGGTTGHERWREQAGWILAGALLAVVFFGYLMPATRYFTAVPGDMGDNRYNSVVLEHLFRVVTGYSGGLWNPDHYYPFEGVLGFSDNHLGSGVTYVIARLLGLPRELAFDVWFVVGSVLNFAAALYALRRLGLSTAAAALGACFFTFALPVPAKDGHAQLVYRFAAPLAMLSVWQMFERRRLVDLGRVAFFTVWQFYCNLYLGLFLAYLLTALTVALLIVRRPSGWPEWRARLAAEPLVSKLGSGALLLASCFALAYLAAQYLLISRKYGMGGWSVEYITQFLPRPGSYLIADASPLLAWVGSDVWVPGRFEHNLFIGFGAAALIVAAAWRGHTVDASLTRAMLIALALLVAGTLWIGYSLYYLIAWLPGINALRAVSRIILIMLLPMSVLVALGAEVVRRRLGSSARTDLPTLAGLAALLVVEPLSVTTSSVPVADWRARVDAVKALLPPAMPKDAIVLVRTGSHDLGKQVHAELDAMVLGQDIGHPVLNGTGPFQQPSEPLGFTAEDPGRATVPPGYRFRRCVQARERLEGYSRFMGGIDISEYARRVVAVDLVACAPK